MKPETLECVDNVIESLCKWILCKLEQPDAYKESEIQPEIIKALTELVSARERFFYE